MSWPAGRADSPSGSQFVPSRWTVARGLSGRRVAKLLARPADSNRSLEAPLANLEINASLTSQTNRHRPARRLLIVNLPALAAQLSSDGSADGVRRPMAGSKSAGRPASRPTEESNGPQSASRRTLSIIVIIDELGGPRSMRAIGGGLAFALELLHWLAGWAQTQRETRSNSSSLERRLFIYSSIDYRSLAYRLAQA